MEKREYFLIGMIFITFSVLFAFGYLTINEFTIALMFAVTGFIGTFFMYKSGKINNETAILSSGMFIAGGMIFPLLSMIKEYSSSLMIVACVVAIALMVLKPPERTSTKVPVRI
ncbi:MAG: hypothetical protein WC386_00885 [Candidatus Paceibacterota bacterium]|jgi:membrane-associated HD superfamily phosphohydrolase